MKHACTDVSCVHHESNINQWHATSNKVCTYSLFSLHIDKAILVVVWVHWPGDNTYGICASTKWHKPTGGTNKCVHPSVMASVHQLMNIKHGLRIVVMWHHLMARSITQGMHTISEACLHHFGDIGHSMHVLARWYRPTTVCINQGLHVASVVCVHLATDIKLWHAAASKACRHNLWRVCIN